MLPTEDFLKFETELKAENFEHKNVVKMDCYFKNANVSKSKGTFLDGKKCGFVYENLDGLSITEYLRKSNQTFVESSACIIVKQIITGLE